MTTFHYFFSWTTHIDVYPSDSISLDYFRGFCEHRWVFAEYLDDEWILICIMCQGSSLELLGVHEPISRVELRKHDCIGCDLLHNLSIWTIAVSIHGC